MPWYYTTYGLYGSTVYAETRDDAKKIVKARGIGETVHDALGSPKPYGRHIMLSNMLENGVPWSKCAHAAAFMSFIAINANVVNPNEILADDGILHEIIHCASGVYNKHKRKKLRKELAVRAKRIEQLIPGWREPDEGRQ